MEQAKCLGDEILDQEDCHDIIKELEQVANRWYDIGLALGLSPSTLDNIKGQGDIYELLRSMIVEWLKMSYNYEKSGKPTWRRIVEAVRASTGGRNPALADELARKYGVMTQDKKPMASLTPKLSTSSGTAPQQQSLFTGICCCCCLAPRMANNHASIRLTTEDEIKISTEQADQEISSSTQQNKPSSVISIPQTSNPNSYDKIIPSFQQDTGVRRYSSSLPVPNANNQPENITLSHLIGSQEGSRDILTAHPTWQIEEVAQQPGYWGAMTGAEAELRLRLKRHGGNCYLIRYSEKQQHFVISVLRRNMHHSTPSYHHFKLSVIKEEGYEIEGTEKKFKDLSALLEFYSKNPLTFSKCTIGKACSPPLSLTHK